MQTVTLDPGDALNFQESFPELISGLNCCDVLYSGVCGAETFTGSERICVTPEEPPQEKTTVLLGLTYLAWSLQDQRLRDFDKVAWSFRAPVTMQAADLVTVHRVAIPPNGRYSDGDGGLVRYIAYEGKLPSLGAKLFESGDIVFHTGLYGPRPASTEQPVRNTGHLGRLPFPFVVNLTKGNWYTVVIQRQTSNADHGSINSFLVPDENRDRKDVNCGILDPCDWQIWRTPNGSSSWQRRTNQIAIFEITDGSGVAFGNGFDEELANNTADRLYNLSGNNQFRWCFNLPYDLDAQEVCIGLVRRQGTDPVFFDIEDAAGNVLHTGQMSFNSNPIPTGTVSGNLNDWLLQHARWQQASLPAALVIPAGQHYIRVRTSAANNFEIAGLRDGVDSGWKVGHLANPADGCPGFFSGDPGNRMEISSNGGASWQLPEQWGNSASTHINPAVALKGCNVVE